MYNSRRKEKGNETDFETLKRELYEELMVELVDAEFKKLNIKKAILQARSPSCGTGKIYSGNFDGKLIHGDEILA